MIAQCIALLPRNKKGSSFTPVLVLELPCSSHPSGKDGANEIIILLSEQDKFCLVQPCSFFI